MATKPPNSSTATTFTSERGSAGAGQGTAEQGQTQRGPSAPVVRPVTVLLGSGAVQQPATGGLLAGCLGPGRRGDQGQGGCVPAYGVAVRPQRLRHFPRGPAEQPPPPARESAGAR